MTKTVACIGAGLSSLLTARELVNAHDCSIDIYEARPDLARSQLISTWLPTSGLGDGAFQRSLMGKWSSWLYAGAVHQSDAYTYCCFDAQTLLQALKSELEESGKVRFQFGQSVRPDALDVDFILDSRPEPVPRSAMIQHFAGWTIELKQGQFDTSKAVLMDFLPQAQDPISFAYVLPFSSSKALVEITSFSHQAWSDQDYQELFEAYCAQEGWLDHQVLDQEAGALPMSGLVKRASVSGRWPIGQPAGWLRPSSGYSLTTQIYMAKRVAAAIQAGRLNVPPLAYPSWLAWMDQVFLKVLRAWPKRGPELFARLADRTHPDALARFMLAQPRASDLGQVIGAMPPWPFIRAAMTKGVV